MLVSSSPRRTGSPVISATGLVGGGVLVRPERIRVDHRGTARHRGELGPGHETTALPQRSTASMISLDRILRSRWVISG